MKVKHLLVFLFLFAPVFLFSQNIYTGTVTDIETDAPIAGASIQIVGTTSGIITSSDGSFSIRANSGSVLEIKSLGYETATITLGDSLNLHIQLLAQAAVAAGDEVVVVGYGTQRRSTIAGSVAKVSGDEITKQPLMNAAQALQGKASGVQVIASGQPGSQPQVRIRGTNSISGNSNPVYVVDGVITDDITNINTSDIESIEVLKDASSQAIYGSRGSNGVILVTTKTGRSGRARITFDTYAGFRTPTSRVKMADARTYAEYTNESRSYLGQAPAFNLDTLKYNTDWFDEITRNGLVQNHVLSVSGGTEKVIYFFSAGFFKDEGILNGNDFTRGTFRLNNEYRLAPFFKIGHNITANINKGNNKPISAFTSAYRLSPTVPVRYPDGNYGYTSLISVDNPVATSNYTNDVSNQLRFVGNMYAELNPVKGLTIRSSFNGDRYNNDSRAYSPAYYIWSGQQRDSSGLRMQKADGFGWIFDNYAIYQTNFASLHDLTLTVGYTSERRKTYQITGEGKGVPEEENLWYLSQSAVGSRTIVDEGSLTRRASYYGRFNYTFDNKYTISGVLRRDGSSYFPENQKWGTFYSIGATWVVSREAFMQNQNVFDNLRLRFGYGKIGNDRLGNYSTLTPVTQYTNAYSFGGGTPVQGISFTTFPSAAYSWETTKGIDAGLEFAVLKRRLEGEIVYYNKLTNAYIPVTIGGAFGSSSGTVISQAADVRNKGMEFSLRWSERVNNDFSYNIGGNITFNNNNVERVNGVLQLRGGSLGNGQVATYTVPGQPIGSFYAYNVIGIFNDSASYKSYPHLSSAGLGDLIFEDRNGDGIIDEKDKDWVGSYQPKTYFGISAGFNWKALDFSIDCYGNVGNKIYNGKKAVLFGNDNIEVSRANNRWTPTNITGTQPRASSSIPQVSTYFVESGDFFRINNITIGYTLNNSWFKDVFSRFRIFASAQNPLIAKKYTGYTPELPATEAISQGIELSVYPVTSTYMMGINLAF